MTTETIIAKTGGRVTGNSVRWDFDSVTDFVNAAERGAVPGDEASSTQSYREEWTGTPNLPTALRLARQGWPEGRERVERIRARIVDRVTSRMRVTEYEATVAGPIFDLGAYLQDDPEFMLVPVERETTDTNNGPVVRVLINLSASSSVDPDIITRRGAATLALADALERAGKRVEIVATFGASRGTARAMQYVTVKRSGDYLNVDAAAFALAHPSSLRRLSFAVWESSPEHIRQAIGLHNSGGYGIPTDDANTIHADIVIPAASTARRVYGDRSASPWSTEATAEAEIIKIIREQGIEIADE